MHTRVNWRGLLVALSLIAGMPGAAVAAGEGPNAEGWEIGMLYSVDARRATVVIDDQRFRLAPATLIEDARTGTPRPIDLETLQKAARPGAPFLVAFRPVPTPNGSLVSALRLVSPETARKLREGQSDER